MDKSDKYIKMCKEAKEIQELHNMACVFENGDFHSYLNQVFVYPVGYNNDSVWLPRQDQLQEMLEYKSLCLLLGDLVYFSDGLYSPYSKTEQWVTPETSLEQIWLAFVMYEKYNKVWSDTEETWKL